MSTELPGSQEEVNDATFSGRVVRLDPARKAFLMKVESTPGRRREAVGRELWFYTVPETFWQEGNTACGREDRFSHLKPGTHVDVLARENVALAVHYVPESGPTEEERGGGESK
ncbi:hypothetical protein [Ammonifex degensii]|uniref:hypothetical protein n=1 Tax=Ammonifex degensii TaxID=42838 RepID=UPI0012EA04F7|nr:hypothetical protein [Ammonifex degensii]